MKKENSKLNKKVNIEKSDFANAPLKKKLGFFSAMLVVVGSCIGSGIFFKAKSVLEGSANSIILAMFCWVFVAFGVLCMALALIEIASARNDNLSLIGWCKTFNSRLIYKFSKNYMYYLYTPIKGFFLPLYLVMAFQDAVASIYIQKGLPYNGFETNADWTIIMLISIVISVYFILICGYSTKIANIQNWIVTSVKFIPLLLAGVVGFVIFGMNGGHVPDGSPFQPGFNVDFSNNLNAMWSFKNLTPGVGFFIAASGILYAYDGFYGVAGIKTEMKKPEKSSTAILVGLIVVTVIYLVIAISMSLGSTAGNPQGLVQFFAHHDILPLFAVFQILIAFGIISVINGYNMFSSRFVEDLVRDGELPFSKVGAKYLAKGSRIVGSVYNLIITIPIIVLFCGIGSVYVNTTDANGVLFAHYDNLSTNLQGIIDRNNPLLVNGGNVFYRYGTGVGSLYTFCDMVSNWSALLIFLFITLALVGGLNNRKHNRVKIQEFKFFKLTAWISIVCMSIPIFMTLVEPFSNLILLVKIPSTTDSFTTDILIPRIMAFVMLIFYILFIVLPTIIEDRIGVKKYGSIEKFDEKKLEEMNIILHKPIHSDSNSLK